LRRVNGTGNLGPCESVVHCHRKLASKLYYQERENKRDIFDALKMMPVQVPSLEGAFFLVERWRLLTKHETVPSLNESLSSTEIMADMASDEELQNLAIEADVENAKMVLEALIPSIEQNNQLVKAAFDLIFETLTDRGVVLENGHLNNENIEPSSVPPSAAKRQSRTGRGKRAASSINNNGKNTGNLDVLSTVPSQKSGHSKLTIPDSHGKIELPENNIRIKVISGEQHLGEEFIRHPVTKNAKKNQVCRIGRSTGTLYKTFGVSLSKDNEVSTKHAMIFCRKNNFYIEDLGSSNGTYLYPDRKFDEESIRIRLQEFQEHKLENGDIICVGATILKFSW
jgi:hypothetical protein